MYKEATKTKLRWQTPLGVLSIEDLWQLPLKSENKDDFTLKSLYAKLIRQRGSINDVDDLFGEDEADEVLVLQVAIVKDVVETKKADIESRKDAVAKASRRQRLLSVLADKDDEELREMSREEIQAEIDAL